MGLAGARNIPPPCSRHKHTGNASKLSRPLPKGTWDSHMHVVDPTRFPLDPSAKYRPQAHTLADAKTFYSSFDSGIENMVLVQPSIYGTDNSCMLEALYELTPKHGRAVVGLDPATIQGDTLQEWHDAGVRGARVNMLSLGRECVTESELRAELEAYAAVLRPLGWLLELFIPLKMAITLEKIVPDLGVKVCVAHFGAPPLPQPYDPSRAIDPYAITGFASLIDLLKKGDTWVKLSAPYRISHDPEMRDLDAIGREFILQGPDRVVYASDWPHTRFDNIDPVPFIEKCFEWCGNETGLIEKLFRSNAEELWDAPGRAN
ncbi:hypothetical protein A1O1_03375 [Capronia coronata CBS 617.96]|uniref:Amidohydrolase-related domain-containing protein n=1 Tax=Capronia coronata CBS 617.96 TaxID=1182541 RepID=W9YM08_9EURO|nr:uncharacterized protein A1O1_03375 [Capronia coronata CBS 617.96]EXJ90276.1 hypothetical protein A1O1_03375 [Capronia coronata CBS 617.96]